MMLLLALCAACAGQRWNTAAAVSQLVSSAKEDIDRQGRDAVLGCHRALAGAGLPVPGSGHWWNAK
jgi:hypothetical protein